MSLSGLRALYLLLLPLVYLFLQPLQEPVLPAQLGQHSLEKGEWERFVGQNWPFPLLFYFPLSTISNILFPTVRTQRGLDQGELTSVSKLWWKVESRGGPG